MKKTIRKTSPSAEAKLELYEKKIDKKVIISQYPCDLPGCSCEPLIRISRNRKESNHVECPMALVVGMKKWKVVCTNCGEDLAYFTSKEASLKGDYYDLHYVCWYDKSHWRGCTTINRNPYTLEINFECACGYKAIREPSLNSVQIKRNGGTDKRYTTYKIVKYDR